VSLENVMTEAKGQSPTEAPSAPQPAVELACECSSILNFAMEQNGVPVVRDLVVTNTGSAPLQGAVVEVQVEPGLASPLRLQVPTLVPGASFRRCPLDLPLVPGKLRDLLEAERGEVAVRVMVGETVAAEHRASIRILAFNEWPGVAAPPGLLATFVVPNHPVITVLLQAVREQLRAATLPEGIDGYQSGNPERVLEQVQALYRAVQALGLGYVGAPASFEQVGQKIRLPDAVLGDRLACCLDLAVLVAAALEQMGLAPLVFLVRGHAFAGVWLQDERFPEGVVEDAARLRTLIELGQVLPLEITTVTASPPVPFETSVAAALQRLRDDEAFGCAVDVRALRGEFRPLPTRAVRAPAVEEAPAAAPQHATAARLLAQAARLPAPESTTAPPPPPTDAAARFRRWKERLLDLTLRNRLLNFKSEGKGSLQLHVPDLELLEDGVFAGQTFDLLPRPIAGATDQRDAVLAERRVEESATAQRLADLQRRLVHARHGPEELWTRLKHLDREARTALEEGGSAILYLAVGFLRWFETGAAEQPLLAPLLLYPIELTFDARVRRARFRRLPEEPLLNVTLLEKLRRDHGIVTCDLETLPMEGADGADGGVDVTELVRRFRAAVQRVPRWEVLEEAHLGLFSFTKFLMWKDLDDNADRFLDSPVVRRIASRELVQLDQGELVRAEEVDGRHPADLPTVLDADSTQLAAMASALDGKSFVLQGPPGTGKSQTITNLVAACLARGKTVLFVSEKMAALEVVHRRLRDVGLADFCLELHSHKANKKQVVESLKASLENAARTPAADWREHGDRLLEARSALDGYVRALHRAGSLGLTVHQARARLLELRAVPEVPLPRSYAAGLDLAGYSAARQLAQGLAAAAEGVEPPTEHPFRDVRCSTWSAGLEKQLQEILGEVSKAQRGWLEARRQLAEVTGVEPATCAGAEDLAKVASSATQAGGVLSATRPDWPESSRRVHAALALRRDVAGRRAALSARWQTAFLELDPAPLRDRFERWTPAFFLFAWIMLWSARRRLSQVARGPLGDNGAVLADLRAAVELRPLVARERDESAWAAGLLGLPGDASAEAWAARLQTLDGVWPALTRLRAGGATVERSLEALVAPAGPERNQALGRVGEAAGRAAARLRELEAQLAELLRPAEGALPPWEVAGRAATSAATTARWERGRASFRNWCIYRSAADQAAAAGLGALGEAHLDGALAGAVIPDVFERSVLDQWHAHAVDAEPILREFDPARHDQRVAQFRTLDREHLAASRRHVAGTLEARLPGLAAAQIASSEPAIIMREAQKKTRLLPVRKLFAQIPTTLRRLKPCFLMSPLSVAQYLAADAEPFDLVVFDEASQICTHDAIGAIARGRQVIVVGDSRQLPPTSFFMRTESEDGLPDDNDVVELESVLDEAKAKLMPEQWLGWHYRSRHESLIDFSNRRIYDGKLEIFPAAEFASAEVGVHWHRVPDGVYQSGSGPMGRTNQREAEALVAHLVARMKCYEPSQRTFGVVTFNMPQQVLVLDLLDEARLDPEVDRHFTGNESLFVKNLENVQGDERDEILFSICSAPDANGRFSVAVGALNQAGGERRLNVAITRARRKLTVFCSFEPEQIERSRTKAVGIWLLRDFLAFARDGRRTAVGPAAAGAGAGAVERSIHQRLVEEGWQVDGGIGCSGYRLDLAVRHPSVTGRYAVAVESDGEAYRSAQTTRDRDRLRAEVLGSLGWKLERAWSSSWWFDERAPDRLVRAIKSALEAPTSGPVASARPPAAAAPLHHQAIPPGPFGDLVPSPRPVVPARPPPVPYRAASLTGPNGDPERFFAPASDGLVLAQVAEVVAIEAPVHLKVLARRVIDRWGIERLTSRPTSRVEELLRRLERDGRLRIHEPFIWGATQEPARYSGFRAAVDGQEAPRELAHIPPVELANAAASVLRDSGSIDRDALAREVARLFGVTRMGANVRETVDAGIDLLVQRGVAEERGERVQLKPGRAVESAVDQRRAT
jgi:hypothetical protein